MKGDELRWLSLSLMWPVSFPLSGHSHRLVRAKVMSDSFSHTSSRIDWACPAQSNHVNPLVVAAFIEEICDMAGKKKDGGRRRRKGRPRQIMSSSMISMSRSNDHYPHVHKILSCHPQPGTNLMWSNDHFTMQRSETIIYVVNVYLSPLQRNWWHAE